MARRVMLLLCWLLVASVAPASALRCGRAIVSKGDYKSEVLRKCGEPVSIDERVIYEVIRVPAHGASRYETYRYHDDPQHTQTLYKEITVPVVLEEWFYNFGSHRFMRVLHFVDGKLRRIKTLEYGYEPQRR